MAPLRKLPFKKTVVPLRDSKNSNLFNENLEGFSLMLMKELKIQQNGAKGVKARRTHVFLLACIKFARMKVFLTVNHVLNYYQTRLM